MTIVNNRIDHLRQYLNDLNILEYEEDDEEYWNNCELPIKNLVENDEDEIENLNRRINCIKIKEREDE